MNDQPIPTAPSYEALDRTAIREGRFSLCTQKRLFTPNPHAVDGAWRRFDFKGTETRVLAQATARSPRVPVTNCAPQRRVAEERIRGLFSYAESAIADFALMQSCHSSLKEIPRYFHFPAKRDPRKPTQWQPVEKREEPRKRTVNLKAKAKARAARKRKK